MNKKEFIVVMQGRCDLSFNYHGIQKCRKIRDAYGLLMQCEGDLYDRPANCPLKEVPGGVDDEPR